MTSKDLIINFITTVFVIIIIIFSIWFFILQNYFTKFTELLLNLAPLIFFGLLLIIKMLITKQKLKKLKKENNYDENIYLYLSYKDKIISDLIIFLLPIIIYIIPFAFGRLDMKTNLMQALIAFLTLYFWEKILFAKQG